MKTLIKLSFQFFLLECIGLYQICCGSNETCNTSDNVCYAKNPTDTTNGGCSCYETSDCLPLWKSWSSYLNHEMQSGVDVVIIPFIYVHQQTPGIPYTGYNISFVVKDEKIRGLAFRLQKCYDGTDSRMRCRYYKFSPAFRPTSAIIYNEEFFFLSPNQQCIIETVGIDENQMPMYYQKFLTQPPPPVPFGSEDDICMWRSLIVVDVTEYHRFPSIYFTTVPRRFNISTYKMRLIENNVPHNWEIFSVSKSIPFVSKEIGPINVDTNYSVELAIGDDDGFSANCYKSSSSVFSFYIEPDPSWVIAIYVTLPLLFIAIIAFVVWKWLMNKKISMDGEFVKLFLVYSYDVPEHSSVVLHFAEYLKTFCRCDVYVDANDIKNKDPDIWITECIESADYVLIIWSRGANLKCRKDNTKVLKNEPGYLGEDLFSNAMIKINAKLAQEMRTPTYHRNLKKYINIMFSYAPNNCLPTQLDYLQCFCIPENFNTLLCFLHSMRSAKWLLSSSSFCNNITSNLKCYPTFQISNLSSNMQGQRLLNAMQEMHQLEKQDPDWLSKLVVEGKPQLPYFEKSLVSIESAEHEVDEKTVDSQDEHDRDDDDDDDDDDESTTISFPPKVHDLPIFGPNISQASCPIWPPAQKISVDSDDDGNDQQFGLPPDVFGPVLSDYRN